MGPIQSPHQISDGLLFVQPASTFGDGRDCPRRPNSGLLLIDQYLPTGKQPAKENLSVGSDDLDA